MNLALASAAVKEAASTARVLLVSNVIMAALLFYVVADRLSIKERIVITPPVVDRVMEVGWGSASREYLESFGMYFVTLIANTNPQSLTFIADRSSAFVSSQIYPSFRKKLVAFANDPVFKHGGSISFIPGKVMTERDAGKVYVMGDLVTATGSSKDQRQVIYELQITMHNGRPMITSIENYDGNEPHTVDWKTAHKEEAAQEEARRKLEIETAQEASKASAANGGKAQ